MEHKLAVSGLFRVYLTCEHESSFPSNEFVSFFRDLQSCHLPLSSNFFCLEPYSLYFGNNMPPNIEAQHTVFNIGEARYAAIPMKVDIPDFKRPEKKYLVTVIPAQAADLENEHWLKICLRAFQDLKDDVWSTDFLDGLLLSTPKGMDTLLSFPLVANMKRHTSWPTIVPGLDLPVSVTSTHVNILSLSLTTTRLVRTCYHRTCSAKCIVYTMTRKAHSWCLSSQCPRTRGMFNGPFLSMLLSNYKRPVDLLGIAGSDPQSLSVAVPSRICSPLSTNSPLLGKRIGVKELFHIAGLRMALSNRAFYAMSTPAQTTAPAIQKLLDAGAVMVGTTKCSSMISREDPVEAVDFQAPFNPRGDGYQSPVGSSSGSAAAIASYEWLDFNIGSDSKANLLHRA